MSRLVSCRILGLVRGAKVTRLTLGGGSYGNEKDYVFSGPWVGLFLVPCRVLGLIAGAKSTSLTLGGVPYSNEKEYLLSEPWVGLFLGTYLG